MLRFAHMLAALLALTLAITAGAAEVRFSVSAREVYVNHSISLHIEIENAASFRRPTMPKIAGAAVNPNPSESQRTRTEVINGRASTRKTIALIYRIVPFQPGAITIPPITISADGQDFTSEPIEILVTESESGDLMSAEILTDRLTMYLGESLRVRLRLWIKPYADRQSDARLNPDQMWSLIDPNATNWGDFAQALTGQRGAFGSAIVSGEEVIRADENGQRGAYFRYEIETTVWPTRTGPIQFQAPTIVLNYPLRTARQRDFFSRESLAILDSRPISVTAGLPPVEVVSPPTTGQPPTFNGAVGDYSISVTARPTEVSVGDPITLSITVRDQGDPETAEPRLNLLPPPPLERVDELTENFRLPSDPLAGAVSGRSKVFTQTIRAKSQNVTRIPPIPISFFDPATETYVTRSSDPIAITVNAGSQIGVNDIVSASSAAVARPRSELRAVSGGILANYGADEALATVRPFRLNALALAWLIAPPLLFAAVSIARTSARFRERNGAAIRRRSAARRANARLRSARTGDAAAQAQVVLSAFSEYVADRLNLPARVFTSAEVANVLREHAIDPARIAETSQLLEQCERLVYSGGAAAHAPPDELLSRARAGIKHLERARLT